MDFSDSTTQYTAGLSLLALTAGFLLFQPTGFVKWLQKKNYQYEVTFSLYMLTPTEKFVFSTFHYPLPIPIHLLDYFMQEKHPLQTPPPLFFYLHIYLLKLTFPSSLSLTHTDSILFLTFSLLLIASVIYLPNHIMTMSRRTYYYFAGDAALMATSRTLYGTATRAADVASEWAQTAYQTAFNRTAVEAVAQEGGASQAAAAAAGESVVETVKQIVQQQQHQQPIGV